MTNRLWVISLFAFLGLFRSGFGVESIEELGPTGPVQLVHEGFAFTEGPAAAPDGSIYFTDIPNSKILRLDSAGQITELTDESRHANGLMFDKDGRLVACEMDGQLARWNLGDELRREVLCDNHQGKRFNAPNDLVIDREGGIYFTDPHFRAPMPLPQGTMGVYYLSPRGDVSQVAIELPAPNGILLSRDEKTLYVLPSGSPEMLAYPVESPGKIGEGRIFCKLTSSSGKAGGADGATLDIHGNLYITSAEGLQVFSPAGKLLGVIKVPQQPANVTFGGPEGNTLYVTARTALYAIPMSVKGHRYATEK